MTGGSTHDRRQGPKGPILFVVGASGVGKTTAVRALALRNDFAGECHFFDSIGVPAGASEEWQARATDRWVAKLVQGAPVLKVLEGQTRPSYIRTSLARHGDAPTEIVLLDCAADVRQRRLAVDRKQPELETPATRTWAAYLRGQADALGLHVIDTSNLDPTAVAAELQRIAERIAWHR